MNPSTPDDPSDIPGLRGVRSRLTPGELRVAKKIDGVMPRDQQPRHYDRDGKPISLGVWAMLVEHHGEYKEVAKTTVGGVMVSTVWLGIDHNWGWFGPPIIFETMVFGSGLDQEIIRYATELEAIQGHERMVALIRLDQELDPG